MEIILVFVFTNTLHMLIFGSLFFIRYFKERARLIRFARYAAAKKQMTETNQIENINQLEVAMSKDVIPHSINDMASLLLNAMQDWPTKDLTKLGEFVNEVKQTFGNFITIEEIKKTKHDFGISGNSWKSESSSSILELINLSKSIGLGDDLEEIVNTIISFYEEDENKVVIDGNKFETLTGFYGQIKKQLLKGNCPWGENLDSLDEIVSENFNYTEEASLNVTKIIWLNFSKSKRELSEKRGKDEIINIVEEIFTSNETINLLKMPTA